MSASSQQKDASFADWVIADPGNAAAFPNDQTGTINLKTVGADETRTLAAPVREGILLTICMETDGGDCILTVASFVDESDSSTITFDNTGEFVTLRSIRTDTGTFGWRVAEYDGVSGITISLPSFTYADSAKLNFGTSNDITMAWDGTDFDVLQATVNSSINWGVAGAGIDQVWYGDTAGSSMTWDQSADSLLLTDDTTISFGDAQDATIAWNATALEILPKTDDTGALNIGDGTTDMDVKVFLGTTGEYLLCDMGASRVTIASAEASAFSVGRLGATTPAFNIDASTADSITGINIKSAGTGAGVAISALGGAAEALTIDAKGTGTITIAGTSTGNVTVGRSKLLIGSTGGCATYCEGVSFTEASAGTAYTGTIEIPAGAIIHDIAFTTTVLWNGTSASLIIGDDDDPNGWFAATDLKATDLVVGEVLSAADNGTWGGKEGDYLTSAGRRGIASGGNSGWYMGAATEVIFLVTPGAADGSAGRSFGWVSYSLPTFTASTNT